MRQRPSTLILFPYTTLFRSCVSGGDDKARAHAHKVGRFSREHVPLSDSPDRGESYGHIAPTHRDRSTRRRRSPRDRKSTRLNSSHGYISYAVFCLKKKKRWFRHHAQLANGHVHVPCVPFNGDSRLSPARLSLDCHPLLLPVGSCSARPCDLPQPRA